MSNREADARFSQLARAFAGDPRVSIGGKGFGSTGLKVDGKLFAFVSSRGQFVVKLPKDKVREIVDAGGAENYDPGHGRLMKEWVALDGGFERWPGLAREARTFVGR